MKKNLIYAVLSLFFIVPISCKKDKQNSMPLHLNKLPAINAGADASVSFTCNKVALAGNASDSDGIISTYLWKQVSGPTQSTIVSPGSPLTLLTNINLGTYRFVLLATDNSGATVSDTTEIMVVPDIQEIIFTDLTWTYDGGDVSSDEPRLNIPARPDLFCDTSRPREIAIRSANSNDWIPVTQSSGSLYSYTISLNSYLTLFGSSGLLIGTQASVRIKFL